MTPEALFINTLDDLDQRLELGRGEYDALCMAWLLRKLFRNGRRSLLSTINPDDTRIDLRFNVWDFEIAPSILRCSAPLVPTVEGNPTIDLTTSEFMGRTCLAVCENNDPDRRHEVTVGRLIDFLANNWGAVHVSRPNNSQERALWDYCWGGQFQTQDGQYSGGVYTLIEIARVARPGLEPLRELLWDSGVRGSQRARDPRNFGFSVRN
jgi:hypothetical protein